MVSYPHWYAVQTKAHAEIKASEHLQRQGFQVYLPRYLKRRRHARVIDAVVAPLFPRYLFVKIDIAAQRWRSIQSTVGVSRLVYQGEYPAVVPDCVLGQIKAREDSRGIIQIDHQVTFASGDKIRVVDGAFADSVGLFDRMSDDERVTVLLELLGRKVRVVMDLDLVAAV